MGSLSRFTVCLTCSAVVTCLICTLVCVLGLGIGVGYNYAYVDFRTRQKHIAGHYKNLRSSDYYGPEYYKAYPLPRLRDNEAVLRQNHPETTTTEASPHQQYLANIVQTAEELKAMEKLNAPQEHNGPIEIPDPWDPAYYVELSSQTAKTTVDGTATRTHTTVNIINNFIGISNVTKADVKAPKVVNDTVVENTSKAQLNQDTVTPTVIRTALELLRWLENLQNENKSIALQVIY